MDAALAGSYEWQSPLAHLRRYPNWILEQAVVYSWLYGLVAGVSYAVRTQGRLRDQEMAAARAETLATRAQLRALRAQLNPHFFFNALHSLTTLVRNDARAAEEALDRLGGLLRYALDEGFSDDVPLANEWEFVCDYLALESLRLGPRLCVQSELDEDALECLVPSFILQPLVENAVRHGLARRVQGGSLVIEASVKGDELLLRVRDDGRGASREETERTSGLGLRTLRQRLEARYNGSSRVEIVTAPGAGFEVIVAIPARARLESAQG
jgi:LytS/YehU family sensor histidine kinase